MRLQPYSQPNKPQAVPKSVPQNAACRLWRLEMTVIAMGTTAGVSRTPWT